MTKFVKRILTTGLIIGGAYATYFGYQYYQENKDSFHPNKSNVSEEKVREVRDFLDSDENIGFLQYNYDEIDLNKMPDETIITLILNPYQTDADDTSFYKRKSLLSISQTKLFEKYKGELGSIEAFTSICLDGSLISDKLFEVTNQKIKFPSRFCVNEYTNNVKKIGVTINYIKQTDDLLNVNYDIISAESYMYVQKNKYQDLDIYDKFNGSVVLKEVDGRYIFISNKLKNNKSLY